ncbi:hypothetical protein COT94_02190 [Candidatus Falkowbacteria bacterium CG10_big_fil_rev_8_21_14_0_10_37_14]|uniref:Uncharacterized protein n=1 Tax=Candidatus Falkowbacteria bacterium CG10_big_fil_rev_8_21_14_0_10_37_14 TaxID=1974561 RepID=A0A2M6WTI2_9BACT|nr:hypothetical protein [Candidatus Falkowbacteria bacterium]PIT96051.1 MAG: hypothetical protein COT94_02190 [Candidatus Falkowbacteria bacterium CG10_big_fil_rev_8_21_14_0_10_37_14]
MFLINYSQDILFVVLAFAVLWLTVFITWLMYYLIMSAKEIYRAARSVKEQVDEMEKMITSFKQKVTAVSTYTVLAGQVASKVVDFFRSEITESETFKIKKNKQSPARASKKDTKIAEDSESKDFMQAEL